MALPIFLSLPLTIREQIYAELLTYLPSTSEKAKAPSSPICTLLTVNRQCHAEVLDFLKSQLCILIQTNDLQLFVHDILEEASSRGFPIISQLKNKDEIAHKDVSKAPVAMKVEIYAYSSHSSFASFPAFLIPAASLKPLLNQILWLPNFTIWTGQSSLSLDIIDTFRHSKERAEELLVQPWADWFLPQKFIGVELDASISKSRANTIKERLLGEYSAPTLIHGIVALGEDAKESIRSGKLDDAVGQCSKADKYAKIVWNCQLPCIQAESIPGSPLRDFVCRLWLATEVNATMLFRCILGAAREGVMTSSAEHNAGLEQARCIGENSIKFLSKHQPYAYDATFHDPKIHNVIRNRQATTSYRISGVCKRLGDLNASVGYLRDALRYDPKAVERFMREIDELVKEGAKDEEDACYGVVRWDLEADRVLQAE